MAKYFYTLKTSIISSCVFTFAALFFASFFPLKLAAQNIGVWQTISASGTPTAREENGFVEAGNKFYLIGGRQIMPVQAYDPASKSWSNKAAPPLELHHFQAVTLNGLIYAAGAFTGPFPHETPVANVYIYNPTSDKWMTGSSVPQSRRRGSSGTVAYKNKIYLVGGITDGHWAGWVNWFDVYDPATNTWNTLPNAPHTRDHFHAVVINDKLYVTGGRRSSASTNQTFSLTVPEVDVFDFNTNQWSTLPAGSNLPVPRAGAGVGVVGNEIIVMGGEDPMPYAHKETHALNITTNTWRRLADLQTGRHGTQAIVSNNGIYTASGAGDQGGTNLLTSAEAFYFGAATNPTTAALQASRINASPVSFASVATGATTSSNLTLTNSGATQDVLVSSIAVSGSSAFTYSSPYPLPFIIPVGKTVNISVKFAPVAAGTQTANIIITHSGIDESTTASLSATAVTGANVYRINAGGGQTTNSIGTFSSDAFYSPNPGNTYSTANTINGTTNGTIYQTERYGTNGTLKYAFPVSNGSYKVVLHFAELYWNATGKRLFDVSIEGNKVLDNYDIFRKAGAFAATSETFSSIVTDGTLNIDFSSLATDGGIDQPKISAIEVIPATPVSYKINAGGPQINTATGIFAADSYFSPAPGNTYSTTNTISGTTDVAKYQTERYGTNGTFSYALPVSNGTYNVILSFAELYWSAAGKRVFDVSIEGNKVLDNYDIFRKVGGFAATSETFTATVTDGVLNIYFSSLPSDGGVDQPKVSAIEISNTNGITRSASHVDNTLSISTEEKDSINLYKGSLKAYPNPGNSGRFTVSLPKVSDGSLSYTLFTSSGAKVAAGTLLLQKPGLMLNFDFSEEMASSGVYYLKISGKNLDGQLKLMRIK